MCSGLRLVNTPTRNWVPRTRSRSSACELVSTIATSTCAASMSARVRWTTGASGVVWSAAFGRSSAPILVLTVVSQPVCRPRASRMALKQVGRAGLAVGARDADDGQRFRGVAVEGGRQIGQRAARIRDEDERHALGAVLGQMFGGNRGGAAGDGLGDELAARRRCRPGMATNRSPGCSRRVSWVMPPTRAAGSPRTSVGPVGLGHQGAQRYSRRLERPSTYNLRTMLETSLPLDKQLARLPDQPGVYKFYDAKGALLYVGKANSLRSRVRSYFQKTAVLEPHKRQMVTEIADIQYLLADTITQALHWEADLVRHERPRYNVKLRDDKHYPYIRINVQEPWPKTMVARKMTARRCALLRAVYRCDLGSANARHDQPALPAHPVHASDHRQRPAGVPVLPHQALSRRRASARSTTRTIGRSSTRWSTFWTASPTASWPTCATTWKRPPKRLEFERAADLRDRIRAAERVVTQQQIVYSSMADEDIIGVYHEGPYSCVQVFLIRGGRLIGREHFVLDGHGEESENEIVWSFVIQYYSQTTDIPDELVLPVMPEDVDAVRVWLTDRRAEGGNKSARKVRVSAPRTVRSASSSSWRPTTPAKGWSACASSGWPTKRAPLARSSSCRSAWTWPSCPTASSATTSRTSRAPIRSPAWSCSKTGSRIAPRIGASRSSTSSATTTI